MSEMLDHDLSAAGPFGQIDGANAELRSINSGFVQFDQIHGAVALRPSNQDVRILIGKMGVGKSLYLRRFHDYSLNYLSLNARAHSGSVYTGSYTRQAANTITTASVRYFSELFEDSELTEMWKLLWRRAIVRSVIAHLLHADELARYVSGVEFKIVNRSSMLLSDQGFPTSIVEEAQIIIETLRQQNPRSYSEKSRHAALKFLQNPDWIKIENECKVVLAGVPEMYFYIDAVDDEYRAAPSYWLRSQKGLFYQIYSLLREDIWRTKLHVMVALRDLVLSSVYTSEHGHRYLNEPHHQILSWTNEAMAIFLERKIASLDDRYMLSPQASSPVGKWLGMTTIYNQVRQTSEPIEQYLLRHTRGTPRDLVQLGNTLCHLIDQARKRGARELDPSDVRTAVSARAADSAYFEFNHCANQVDTDLGAVVTHRPERYRGDREYEYNSTARTIRELISELAVDRFDYEVVQNLARRGREAFQSVDIDLPSILWQNGLLGYVPDPNDGHLSPEECCFYSEPTVGSIELWNGAREYVLHPILLDKLPSLTPLGPPVIPVPGLCNH